MIPSHRPPAANGAPPAGPEPAAAVEPEPALATRLEAEAALVAGTTAGALVWALSGLLHLAPGRAAVVTPVAHRVRLEGAPLDRLVALSGATPVEIGTVADCPEAELAAALAEAAAGLLVVGAGAAEVVAPARFLRACHRAGRPAVILDPASGRWAAWADGGATLVVADGRAVAAVPCGILAGRREAIAACRAAAAAAALCRAEEPVRRALAAALAGSPGEQA